MSVNKLPRASKEEYLLSLALSATIRSEDPWRRVAAIAADVNGHVLATGYNGSQAGEILTDDVWQDRELRLKSVVHAEMNVLSCVRKHEVHTVACTLAPCLHCAKSLVLWGVKNVVYMFDYNRDNEGVEYLRKRITVVKHNPQHIWQLTQVNVEALFKMQADSELAGGLTKQS